MPVVASTYVDSRLGVPSACRPPLRTSHARRGVAPVASTTSVGSEVVRRLSICAVALAGASALPSARAAVVVGVVATLSGSARVWLTPCQVAAGRGVDDEVAADDAESVVAAVHPHVRGAVAVDDGVR